MNNKPLIISAVVSVLFITLIISVYYVGYNKSKSLVKPAPVKKDSVIVRVDIKHDTTIKYITRYIRYTDTNHVKIYDTLKLDYQHFSLTDSTCGISNDSVTKYWVKHISEFLEDSIKSTWNINIQNNVKEKTVTEIKYIDVPTEIIKPFYKDTWFYSTFAILVITIMEILK